MNHFSRLGTLICIAAGVFIFPFARAAGIEPGIDFRPGSQSFRLLLSKSLPNSTAGAAEGYLGVGMHDVDNDRAAALKLKEARGAEIVSIDQDAPAAKSGIKIHDVVVQMNGQRIEGIEQFRRMLRETPPGRTVSLVAMRDGQPVAISVQLADRAALATQIIGGLDSDPPPPVASEAPPPPPMLPSGRGSRGGSFLGNLIRSRYYVGVELESLPTGLADYFGVKGGVLVGNVFPNSPAASAGLKPADVIQRVNGQPIGTLSDWEKAIRVHHGKPIQVTIIRDHKEQTLTMVAGSGKSSG
jgi:S1-C subfamily serine protease